MSGMFEAYLGASMMGKNSGGQRGDWGLDHTIGKIGSLLRVLSRINDLAYFSFLKCTFLKKISE